MLELVNNKDIRRDAIHRVSLSLAIYRVFPAMVIHRIFNVIHRVSLLHPGKLIIVLFLLMGSFNSFSQTPQPPVKEIKPKVEVIARSLQDSIILRWAPNKADVWQYGNTYGYKIQRLTLSKDGVLNVARPEKKELTPQSIKPWPLDRWEPLAMKNKYAAIAAQAIYGDSFEFVDNSNKVMSFVNRAKDLQNRFSFSLFAADQAPEVANAHGLRFVDRNIKKGEKYVYRVYINAPIEKKIKVDTGFIYLAANDTFQIPKPVQLEARFGDKIVELSWNKVYFENIFSTYFIERSDDEGKTFKRLSDLPIINAAEERNDVAERMYTLDSVPANNKKYVYRVRGLTPFGEISPPSDVVEGKGKAKGMGVNPMIVNHELLKDGGIKINWEFPEEYNALIKGFKIVRGDNASSEFENLTPDLLPPGVRTFTDKKSLPVNYYLVKAIDQNDVENSSFPALAQLQDSIPPSPPIGLTGKIDTSGIVTINWLPNKEEDVTGYRVFLANNPNDDFSHISADQVRTTQYNDTTVIKTLSKYIYYKIAAVDRHFNQSKLSNALALKRPDVIPPVSPNFSKVEASTKSVNLEWIPSSSEDVVKHVLYRKGEYERDYKVIATFDSASRIAKYEDKDLVVGKDYEYIMIAIDDFGLESIPSRPIKSGAIDNGIRAPFKEFYGAADRQVKKINLSWQYPGNIERFVIYRAEPGKPLRILKALPGDVFSYIDSGLIVNSVYNYKIQAFFADGAQSPLSKELTVKY